MKQPESASKQELDLERMRILYKNLNFGYLGIASGIAILYFTAARYASPALALDWLLLVSLANLPRIAVSIQFTRKIKAGLITKYNVKPWEYYITVLSGLAYLALVSVIYLPYGDNTVTGIMVCGVVFMSMATGGVLTLSTSLPAIFMYITLAMLSIVGRMFMLHDRLFFIVAVILALGYLQILKMLVAQNRTIVENISLKIAQSRLALIDPLTKLWNRRRLDLYVGGLIPSSQRSGNSFSLIMLDIDHFKQYNDVNGHAAGDELLIRVANVLSKCAREQDLVMRYGGEEFLLVFPHTRIGVAEVIAERIRTTVKDSTEVTVSAGLAEYCDGMSFEQLVSQADDALYAAKNGGRDRYVLASQKFGGA